MDENIQRRIVASSGAGPDSVVVEIGPGTGALTRHLAGNVRHLVLVELDDQLASDLTAEYGARSDLTVVHGDVLDFQLADAPGEVDQLLVIGNIPYNITTPILFHLLDGPRPREILLMVQDDVASRIVADVGTKEYGALSVGVRTVADVERLFRVGRNAFRPVPRVDSAIIRVRPVRPPPLTLAQEEALRSLVRACFQWRRKQLGKILRDHPDLKYPGDVVLPALDALGVPPSERPERLSPQHFVQLSAALP